MEKKSKKPIVQFRTHITIGNDEITTSIYEVPKDHPVHKKASGVETLRAVMGIYDELYFPETLVGQNHKSRFHWK